ncbi:MAG: cbb3-type cytochrome c oxidase subunit I [Gemmatimonas sp.]
MEWFVKAYLRSSLSWLAAGVTVGVAMAAHPVWTVYRPAHVHMVLLGFVTMMIYGVAYHVIPRFTGFPLYSRRAPVAQLWLSNIGLFLMVAGFAVRANGILKGTPVLATGGVLAAMGAYTFVFVIWRTIGGRAKVPRSLPVKQ